MEDIYDIFEIPLEKRYRNPDKDSLGSLAIQTVLLNPRQLCYIELTMNWPPTASYNRLDFGAQELFYREKLRDLLRQSNYEKFVVKYDQTIEFGQNGKMHTHISLLLNMERVFLENGVIADLSRAWRQLLPRRHAVKKYEVYYLLRRYKSPSLLLQYVDYDDKKRTDHWDIYIRKDIISSTPIDGSRKVNTIDPLF